MPKKITLAPRTKILLAIGIIFALAFIAGRMTGMFWLRMATKPIPVLLMALYLLLLPHKNRFRWLVFAGLLLGATGDILLEYSPDTFLPGLIIFLLGHILYILAFLTDSRQPGWGVAIFVYLYGIAIYSLLEIGHLGDMALPVLIYIFVITTMVWRAATRYQAPGVNQISGMAGMIGAALFLLSDSLLAITLFIVSFPLAGVIVIITYWLGQLGITLAAANTRDASPDKGS